jgi:SAM-dependent methyltransferase
MVDVSAKDIKVNPLAFKYLRLQKGKLEPLSRNMDQWLKAYRAALAADYTGIHSYLPKLQEGVVGQVLDVGSGLGGIDILLYRHYSNSIVPVLLDGWKDAPRMDLHRKTYNDMDVAERFHRDNGVVPVVGVDANMRPIIPLSYPAFLVISLGSWCFHYAPELYLEYVLANTTPEATIIVDVRKEKPEWKHAMDQAFNLKAVIHGAAKFDRCVYERY